jgi:hypothetical protein
VRLIPLRKQSASRDLGSDLVEAHGTTIMKLLRGGIEHVNHVSVGCPVSRVDMVGLKAEHAWK